MNGQNREDIKPGIIVEVVLKEDQASGKLTRGIVAEILTSSSTHHRGIKVRLEDGQVGRVQRIVQYTQKDIVEDIHGIAESFREVLESHGIKLGYDRESVLKLDDLIDQVLSAEQPTDRKRFILLFASFLGDAIIATLGGTWQENKNGNMAVVLPDTNGQRVYANVISKVEKRFANGREDSLTYYYQMLEKMLSEGSDGKTA